MLFKVALAATLWHFGAQAMAQNPQGGARGGAQSKGPKAGGPTDPYGKLRGAKPGSDAAPDESAATPAEQPLPDNVTEWVREHYYRARRDGDPRLKDAVEYLGKQFKGVTRGGKADKAAKLLTNLLRPQEPKSDAPAGAAAGPGAKAPVAARSPQPAGAKQGYPPSAYPARPGAYPGQPGAAQSRPLDADSIKAIIQALAVNDSRTARETLNEVLRGTFKSDDDRVATEGLLESMAALPTPEHEDVLFRVVTDPSGIRPAPKVPTQPVSPAGRGPGAYGSGGYGSAGASAATKSYGYAGKTATSGYGAPGAAAYPPRPSASAYPGSAQLGQAKMTGAEMQSLALILVDQFGSQTLRIKIAELLAQAATADDVRQAVLPMLSARNPRNLPAQTVLYRSEGIDKGSRDALEHDFVKYSSAALATLMRIPEELPSRASGGTSPQGPSRGPYGPQRGPGGQRPTSDAARPQSGVALMAVQAGVGTRGQPGARGGQPGVGYGGGGAQGPYGAASALTGPLKDIPGFEGEAIAGLAGPLWATDFTKVIEARLGVDVVESLETDSATIVLASTIPTDAVRAKVYRLLEKHYQHQGGKSLEAAGLAGDVLSDPGLLVTMKLLVRKEASKTRPTATRTRDRKGKGEQSGGRGGSTTPAQPSQQAATPSEEWTGTAERLVRSLCERLAVAGKLTKGSSAPAEKRLFEIPPIDVQVVSEYHLDWPDDLAERGKLSGVSLDPMTVHYVRYHQTASVNKALAFYRQPKQLGRGSLTERTVASGIWLESLRTVPESRRRLSVDVLVTKPEANSAATPGQGGAGVGYPARGGYGPGTRSGGSDPSRGGGQPGTMTAKEKNETAELVIEVIAVQTNNFAASDEAAEPAAAEPEAAKEKQ